MQIAAFWQAGTRCHETDSFPKLLAATVNTVGFPTESMSLFNELPSAGSMSFKLSRNIGSSSDDIFPLCVLPLGWPVLGLWEY